MDCIIERGTVVEVKEHSNYQELTVSINGENQRAINYHTLTGRCKKNDSVILNTTAVQLELGSGGYHFVIAIEGQELCKELRPADGHIMKLRYTPLQGRVLSVEEPASNYHHVLKEAKSIDGLPVIVGTLHSMLAPAAFAFNFTTAKRLVYLMSDGAALPLSFSRIVPVLQQRGLIYKTITFGNAFGGDFEAVNVFSALLAAKHVCQADAAIILMGPGVVGTDTRFGTTAVEQGVFLNAINSLGGTPISILRVSLADARERHQGISHHTLTALEQISLVRGKIAVPLILKENKRINEQLLHLEQLGYKIVWIETTPVFEKLIKSGLELSSMKRGPQDDPAFFHCAIASGMSAALVAERKQEGK